ncbi:hypothetical protein GCM10023165_39050 [Variovorax defluvii]|uniref:HTH araC/xylS-type domain-containing protein n=1 Tax=Variovorax defluvii TaxID=913761 RepID=A0ABP8I4A1_9BURK
MSGLVVNRGVLERQLATSSPFLRKLAREQLAASLPRSPGSFSMKVRVIQRMIGEGYCEARAVAQYFRVDRRTLNRRLEHDGESYSSILQRVRVDVACRALHGSDCSMSQVADAAGFDSLSAFSRWFQRSFACTASEWRARQHGGARRRRGG